MGQTMHTSRTDHLVPHLPSWDVVQETAYVPGGGKLVLGYADYLGLTPRHELDHAAYTDQGSIYLIYSLKYLQ